MEKRNFEIIEEIIWFPASVLGLQFAAQVMQTGTTSDDAACYTTARGAIVPMKIDYMWNCE